MGGVNYAIKPAKITFQLIMELLMRDVVGILVIIQVRNIALINSGG